MAQKELNRDYILELLREDYRNRDLDGFRRHFLMGRWLLTSEDNQKLVLAQKKLENMPPRIPEDAPDMVKLALKILGGRVVSS